MIYGVGVFEELILLLLGVDPGIGALVVVFAVVIVQVGVDDDVDVFGSKVIGGQGVFEFLEAIILLPARILAGPRAFRA